MASLKTSNPDKGFTFVEVFVVVAIMAIIVSLGLVLSMDFYRAYAFSYEKDLIVALLRQVRSKAMANISQSSHGITFNSANHEYEILEDGLAVQTFRANDALSITWPTAVIFNQLEGACPTCNLTIINLSGLGKTSEITINNEGRIDY